MNPHVIKINGDLVFPPSEIMVVRDVTLYTNVFIQTDIIIEIEKQYKDMCYKYMKSSGAFDYVEDIVTPGEESGVLTSDMHPCNIKIRKFHAGNLSRIIAALQTIF